MPLPGPGRPKGSINKATKNARAAIAALVEANIPKVQRWLNKIAKDEGPKAAFQCLMDLVEYHVPKLARTELTGPDGGPVEYRDKTDAELLAIIEKARKVANG